MAGVTLSSAVRAHPHLVHSSLEKMTCNAQGIDVVDIYPSVLSALLAKGAPSSVTESGRAYLQAARCGGRGWLTRAGHRKAAKEGAADEDSYLDSFNVGIAMSLHTVLLSRNRISSLLGIVQFRHCVRLSLISNRIRTIDDCEPLALLPDLQYLSLEYNPVTQLPLYRAHVLRICSWPQELSPTTCRLRKLDSAPVTTAEVKRAVVCLLRESALLPELLYRMQLLAFLVDVERRQRLHHELRRRGHVFQDVDEAVKVELLLERGVAHAVSRVSVTGAAHLARQLVRDECVRNPGPSPHLRQHGQAAREHSAEDRGCESEVGTASPTVTYFGSDAMDSSGIDDLSSVASCSLFSDAAADNANALQSLSRLLATKELDWSRRSLRRADEAAVADMCREWSTDAFRHTIVSLDVRLCALLLRVSRALGQALTSHDMDRLCEVWLRAVAHCTVADAAELNATGPRRPVVDYTATAVRGKESGRGAASAATATAVVTRHLTSSPRRVAVGRLPVETPAPVQVSVWEALDKESRCLSSSAASSAAKEGSVECTEVSVTSLSSDAVSLPRDAAPQPTARTSAGRSRGSDFDTLPPPPAEACAAAPSRAVATAVHCDPSHSIGELQARQLRTRRIFQHWRSVLRRRLQARLATAYIREKLSDGAVVHLRSPSWGGLITQVTYVERKRGLFAWWRQRAQTRWDRRTRQLRGSWNLWRKRVATVALHRARREEEEEAAAAAASARRLLTASLQTWKARAERRAGARCVAARRRIVSAAAHCADTFLTLRSPALSPVAHPVASTPSPQIVASRRTLAGVLTPGANATASPTSAAALSASLASGVSDAESPTAAAARSVLVSVWCPSSARARRAGLPATSPLQHGVAAKGGDGDAGSVSDNESRLSAETAAASPSPGVSATSGTATPSCSVTSPESWGWGQQQRMPPHRGRTADVAPAHGCGGGGVEHELAPPPAIRILFPSAPRDAGAESTVRGHARDAADTQDRPTREHRTTAPDAARMASPTLSSSRRFYGASKPSCLPSTTAARRAIVQPATRLPATARDAGVAEPLDEVDSPYPAADVEALVHRAQQLEFDRDYLIDAVRRLRHSPQAHSPSEETLASSPAGRRPIDRTPSPSPSSSSPLAVPQPVSSAVAERLEMQCSGLETEVRRLEDFVVALQEERHQLLSTMETSVFRFC
ncbi:hypothetical protein NESM_000792600 [Novymonas esmeraldas]|uniref:Uncharacterized protein n=1 Tax=Novymonas esmeraldas TaxID=1808958 RepID=A0AAW0EW45_9TRYP